MPGSTERRGKGGCILLESSSQISGQDITYSLSGALLDRRLECRRSVQFCLKSGMLGRGLLSGIHADDC